MRIWVLNDVLIIILQLFQFYFEYVLLFHTFIEFYVVHLLPVIISCVFVWRHRLVILVYGDVGVVCYVMSS